MTVGNFITLKNVVIENKADGIPPTQVSRMLVSKNDIVFVAIRDDRILPEIEAENPQGFIMKLADETVIKGSIENNPEIMGLLEVNPQP